MLYFAMSVGPNFMIGYKRREGLWNPVFCNVHRSCISEMHQFHCLGNYKEKSEVKLRNSAVKLCLGSTNAVLMKYVNHHCCLPMSLMNGFKFHMSFLVEHGAKIGLSCHQTVANLGIT